jgi:hypothetical protein
MPNRYVKITVVKDCQAGSVGIMLAGEDHDVRDTEAQKLIERGFAKPFKAAKAVKKPVQETVAATVDAD